MISRIANLVSSVEGVIYLLTAIVGVGCIGYVAASWVIYFVNTGQYLVAATFAFALLAITVFAAVRVPIALWCFFGTTAVLGTAFFHGLGYLMLP